jgi:hypothetical protein
MGHMPQRELALDSVREADHGQRPHPADVPSGGIDRADDPPVTGTRRCPSTRPRRGEHVGQVVAKGADPAVTLRRCPGLLHLGVVGDRRHLGHGPSSGSVERPAVPAGRCTVQVSRPAAFKIESRSQATGLSAMGATLTSALVGMDQSHRRELSALRSRPVTAPRFAPQMRGQRAPDCRCGRRRNGEGPGQSPDQGLSAWGE